MNRRGGLTLTAKRWIAVCIACATVACTSSHANAQSPDNFGAGQVYDPNGPFYEWAGYGDFTHALRFLATTARTHPRNLAMIKEAAIASAVAWGLEDEASRSAALQAVEALYDAHWTPKTTDLDEGFYDLAVQLAEQGDTAKADAIAGAVRNPRYVLRLAVDNRFADAGLDPTAAAKAEVGRTYMNTFDAPLSLDAMCRYLRAVIASGEATKAIMIADGLIGRPKDSPAFADRDEQAPQLLDQRASALAAVGRMDDAVADASAADKLPVADPNASAWQEAFHAALLIEAARPAEALKVIALLGRKKLPPSIETGRQLVRACAASELNDQAQAADATARLRQGGRDASESLVQALLCTEKLDDAATAIVADLADPRTRGDALMLLQDYTGAPNPAPWFQRHRSQIAQLRQRPEVVAAIAKVGRIGTWPFPDE